MSNFVKGLGVLLQIILALSSLLSVALSSLAGRRKAQIKELEAKVEKKDAEIQRYAKAYENPDLVYDGNPDELIAWLREHRDQEK
jgi:hypothetical protein